VERGQTARHGEARRAAEIFDAAETIHGGTIPARGTQSTPGGSAIAFEHPTARGFGSAGSVTDGFSVRVDRRRAGGPCTDRLDKRYVHSLDRCVTTAVARICAYSRDGAF